MARLVVLVVALAAGAGTTWFLLKRTAVSWRFDPPAVIRQIQPLRELVTVQYLVQKIVTLEEKKQPLGTESILLIVQARVLAGVDLGKLQPPDLQVGANRRVVVRLPKAEILHVYLDDKETRVWDRRITWWTPWVPYNPDLERQARLAGIESARQAAIEMGIVSQARRNAEELLRGLLAAFGARSVTFAGT